MLLEEQQQSSTLVDSLPVDKSSGYPAPEHTLSCAVNCVTTPGSILRWMRSYGFVQRRVVCGGDGGVSHGVQRFSRNFQGSRSRASTPTPSPLTPRCRDRLYLGVLEDRLGVSEGGLPDKVSESALLDSFKASLKQRSREMPCFGAGVMSSEDWWAEVVRATFRGAGVSDATLGIEEGGSVGGGVFDDVFDRLFHDVFTSTTAWELVPVGCPPPPPPPHTAVVSQHVGHRESGWLRKVGCFGTKSRQIGTLAFPDA